MFFYDDVTLLRSLLSHFLDPGLTCIADFLQFVKLKIKRKYSVSIVFQNLAALFQYGVITLKDECKPLIHDILHIIVTVFRECPQANILTLAKTVSIQFPNKIQRCHTVFLKVLILFGKEDQFLNVNQQLLHEIVNTSLQMCANVSATSDLSDKADVLEAFFSMMANLVKKVPQLINKSGIDTAAIFQCGKSVEQKSHSKIIVCLFFSCSVLDTPGNSSA